jgi:hypothetical protein
MVLSFDEARLVDELRSIPESRLRELTLRLVSELASFAARPGCPELQADGAPCPTADAACDECRRVGALLESLRTRLHGA